MDVELLQMGLAVLGLLMALWTLGKALLFVISCTLWVISILTPQDDTNKSHLHLQHTQWSRFSGFLFQIGWILVVTGAVKVQEIQTAAAVEAFDPFSVLGLQIHTKEQAEVKNAYKALSRKFHPDKNPSQEAQTRFVQISRAYYTLSDPDEYAQWIRGGSGPKTHLNWADFLELTITTSLVHIVLQAIWAVVQRLASIGRSVLMFPINKMKVKLTSP